MKTALLFASATLSTLLALSMSATAQDAAAPAAQKCSPSDIAGEWLMMTNNDYAPSICLLKINKNGEVKKGECTTGKEDATLVGEIVVDKNCAIAGKYKLKTPNGTFSRDASLGIMSPDHSYFTMVGVEKNGKELTTNFVQRIPQ